jgi:hypothetical protein
LLAMRVFYRRRLSEKIVFLDFDGVLMNRSALRARRLDPQRRPVADPEAVAALNYIVRASEAQIVVTSTWREEYSLRNCANTCCAGAWPASLWTRRR